MKSTFTISSIKADRNGNPYLVLFAKDGGRMFKVNGIAAMTMLIDTVDANGDGMNQGDLISIEFDSIRDNSWTAANGQRVAQFALNNIGATSIVARKGCGIQIRGRDGAVLIAHKN